MAGGDKTRARRWPSPPTDTDMDSQQPPSPVQPTGYPSDDDERGLARSGSLMDMSSATRREVLDSLRWRLEAEKSVKIGEELQFLVLEQQHEIADLRAQIHNLQTKDGPSHAAVDVHQTEDERSVESVQLRKDLRQARRDNEALGRRAVAEEERAEKLEVDLQAAEQEKHVAEQVVPAIVHHVTCIMGRKRAGIHRLTCLLWQERRALSSKVDDLLRQIAKLKHEREHAANQLQDSECAAKELEVGFFSAAQ